MSPCCCRVSPAGFTGMLQVVLTVTPDRKEGALFISIDSPYFAPTVDPSVISSLVEGARTYMLQSFGLVIPAALVPDLEQYVSNQLQLVVINGREMFTASLGTAPQVYSLSQLQLDVAVFGARRALTGNAALEQPRDSPTWLAPAEDLLTSLRAGLAQLQRNVASAWRAFARDVAFAQPREFPPWLATTYRLLDSFVSAFGISRAQAQTQNCYAVSCSDPHPNKKGVHVSTPRTSSYHLRCPCLRDVTPTRS